MTSHTLSWPLPVSLLMYKFAPWLKLSLLELGPRPKRSHPVLSEHLQASHPTPIWTDSQRDKGAMPRPDAHLPLVVLYWKGLPTSLFGVREAVGKGLSGFLSWIPGIQVYCPSTTRQQKSLLSKYSMSLSVQLLACSVWGLLCLGPCGWLPQFLSLINRTGFAAQDSVPRSLHGNSEPHCMGPLPGSPALIGYTPWVQLSHFLKV